MYQLGRYTIQTMKANIVECEHKQNLPCFNFIISPLIVVVLFLEVVQLIIISFRRANWIYRSPHTCWITIWILTFNCWQLEFKKWSAKWILNGFNGDLASEWWMVIPVSPSKDVYNYLKGFKRQNNKKWEDGKNKTR